MRLTIERLRTLVLAAGILILASLALILGVGKWKNRFIRHDIPQRLGIDIQQQANGFTYTQSRGGHTLFRIHASRVVQLKKGNALLNQVVIELFGEDGASIDRIEGNEFEYDQQAGIARATGPVEITLTRPGQALAIAPNSTPQQALSHQSKDPKIAAAVRTASRGEVHVKTSGLVFNQSTDVASTTQRVEFSLAQGSGSAVGASFNSDTGSLELLSAVDITIKRANAPVHLQAQHALFDRYQQQADLSGAQATYQGSNARAGRALVFFRADGSAERLEASSHFELSTASGGRLAAPTGTLIFDAHNQPQKGTLTGGVEMNESHQGRTVHGTAPTMDIAFNSKGELQHAHMERGVEIVSDEQGESAGKPMRAHRAWRSPVVDLDFRNASSGGVELASMHGAGGVTVNGETQRASDPPLPSRFAADDVTGNFGPQSALLSLIGAGHAQMEQTTASGAHQTTSGDRIEAHFAEARTESVSRSSAHRPSSAKPAQTAGQIDSAIVDGNVVVIQQTPQQPNTAPSSLRATAARAVYQSQGDMLHLIGSPRVQNDDLQLAADSIDVARASGDAAARGNVKATWFGAGSSSAKPGSFSTLGASGPAHAVAAQADLSQSSGEVKLQGGVRLWQGANSIAAPVIVLNRRRQVLTAHTGRASTPVEVVLVSAAPQPGHAAAAKQSQPSVVRVFGGDLKYSAAERKAWMNSGSVGSVRAETAGVLCTSSSADLVLLPPGNHAGKDGAEAQVDTLTAAGGVTLTQGTRTGVGDKLVYTGSTGQFVLTGTPSAPPRLIDPTRGSVTGAALIFNSADDSVSIEGGGQKTTTETRAPK